jgi:hypothetical protein
MSNGLTLPFSESIATPGNAFSITNSDSGFAIHGTSSANNGIHGDSTQSDAVVGVAHAQGKSGVLGISNGPSGTGVTGTSTISHGVHGMNGNGANNPPLVAAGLWGETDGGFGVYGASIANNGIHGDSTQSDAVVGVAHAKGKSGVLGSSDNGNGVSGVSTSGNGVFGSGGQFAGFFQGNVTVTDRLFVGSRKIARSVHEAARDKARAIAKTEAYAVSCRERKKVEMLFAHLKRILRLGRLRLRGPNGAKDEFLLAATAQNLRKLAKLPAPGANLRHIRRRARIPPPDCRRKPLFALVSRGGSSAQST